MAPTVLVVDDDDDVRSLVALQLTISGYEVVERLLTQCLAEGQPVILMTASVETRDLPASTRDGVHLLRKPFPLDDLARAVADEVQG